MTQFTPWSALLGGALIGLAATVLRLFAGKTAGISGIAAGALDKGGGWQRMFLLGLVLGGIVVVAVSPSAIVFSLDRSPATIVAAGLLVGFGTQLGSGCTSGHGVCGISQGSSRSIAATITFMGVAILTVALMRWLSGGVA